MPDSPSPDSTAPDRSISPSSLPTVAQQIATLQEHGLLSDADARSLTRSEQGTDTSGGLLVIPGLATGTLAPLLRRGGKEGFVVEDFTDVEDLAPIASLDVPPGPYLLQGVHRGDELRNASPAEALPALAEQGRSPLTLTEGLLWLLAQPQVLEPNHCFMTIGSRLRKASGALDARTPAIWISGGTGRDGSARRGAPKVGWCWAGNRHTWLGFASTTGRRALPTAG